MCACRTVVVRVLHRVGDGGTRSKRFRDEKEAERPQFACSLRTGRGALLKPRWNEKKIGGCVINAKRMGRNVVKFSGADL